MAEDRVELLQGTLDMLVLKALADGAKHGYGVARWIETRTDDVLRVEEGSLYPALQRMKRKGWIRSEWGTSENNRRARFYDLTDRGRERLDRESSSWSLFARAVGKVMGTGS